MPGESRLPGARRESHAARARADKHAPGYCRFLACRRWPPSLGVALRAAERGWGGDWCRATTRELRGYLAVSAMVQAMNEGLGAPGALGDLGR